MPACVVVHALIWAAMLLAIVLDEVVALAVPDMTCKLLTVMPLTLVLDVPDTTIVAVRAAGERA